MLSNVTVSAMKDVCGRVEIRVLKEVNPLSGVNNW
jgi:hypothetical protein